MELKNCPFCGSDNISMWWQRGKYGRFAFIKCGTCEAQTGTKALSKNLSEPEIWEDDAFRNVANRWNRREGMERPNAEQDS